MTVSPAQARPARVAAHPRLAAVPPDSPHVLAKKLLRVDVRLPFYSHIRMPSECRRFTSPRLRGRDELRSR